MGSTPTRNNPRFLHSRTKPLQTLYVCRYENLSIPPGQRLLYRGRHRAVWVCTQIIADGTPIVDESRIYNAPPISNARTVSNATTISNATTLAGTSVFCVGRCTGHASVRVGAAAGENFSERQIFATVFLFFFWHFRASIRLRWIF